MLQFLNDLLPTLIFVIIVLSIGYYKYKRYEEKLRNRG